MNWLISSLQIHDGIVIYVGFYKGASEKILPKMGKNRILNDINKSITFLCLTCRMCFIKFQKRLHATKASFHSLNKIHPIGL